MLATTVQLFYHSANVLPMLTLLPTTYPIQFSPLHSLHTSTTFAKLIFHKPIVCQFLVVLHFQRQVQHYATIMLVSFLAPPHPPSLNNIGKTNFSIAKCLSNLAATVQNSTMSKCHGACSPSANLWLSTAWRWHRGSCWRASSRAAPR